jgi:hypothetical protein
MPTVLDPIQFVLIALAGWMNQRQLQTIKYLREENRVLREQLGDRRLRFNDDQRRRLAAKAKGLGRGGDVWLNSLRLLRRTPCWHGIESSLLRNTMAASAADLGDRARAQNWKLWWFAWRKRIGVGAIGGFRVPYPI